MGKFVAVHLLKQYNPGTFNRGEDGEAKQIIVGGTNRVRFSSQCQKRAIREMMACDEIRTGYIENLISGCLDVYVKEGKITEEEKDLIGNAICSKEVIGTPSWNRLKKDEAPKKSKKKAEGEDKKEKEEEKTKNIVVNTNSAEISALINTFVDYLKANGPKDLSDPKKIVAIAKSAALNDVSLSVAKSLFGTMATDGILGTVDGALEMGQAYSVDEYMPETDVFTVKFTGRSGADKSDPFFGAYNDFSAKESQKRSGETFNTGLSLSSNLMYSYANINLKEFERNLNTFVVSKESKPENDEAKATVIEEVPKFVQAMIEMTPEATQHRSSSHIAPTVVLIEVIDDGANIQPDWSKAIRNKGAESISEQAIKRLAQFANDKTFRSGDIQQFVMVGSDYADFAKEFDDAKQIKNFNELTKTLQKAIKALL